MWSGADWPNKLRPRSSPALASAAAATDLATMIPASGHSLCNTTAVKGLFVSLRLYELVKGAAGFGAAMLNLHVGPRRQLLTMQIEPRTTAMAQYCQLCLFGIAHPNDLSLALGRFSRPLVETLRVCSRIRDTQPFGSMPNASCLKQAIKFCRSYVA